MASIPRNHNNRAVFTAFVHNYTYVYYLGIYKSKHKHKGNEVLMDERRMKSIFLYSSCARLVAHQRCRRPYQSLLRNDKKRLVSSMVQVV